MDVSGFMVAVEQAFSELEVASMSATSSAPPHPRLGWMNIILHGGYFLFVSAGNQLAPLPFRTCRGL